MQLVDNKLYSANLPRFHAVGDADAIGELFERHYEGADRNFARRRSGGGDTLSGRARNWNGARLVSRLAGSSASERLLALMLAAFVVTASPALLTTVRATVSLSLQILLQAGHFGLVAFQIFGR